MARTFAAALALLAVAASPVWSATARSKAMSRAPSPTLAQVLMQSGAIDDGNALRDLIGPGMGSADDFAAQRAAIRACHAQRYAEARENVLSGRRGPVRTC